MEKKTKEILSGNSDVPYLLSIPGVGIKTALAFSADIGDGTRFSSGVEVTNYAGMVQRLDFSGDRMITGHIHKRGPSILRALFVQAAWSLVHSKDEGELKQRFEEIRAGRGKKIGIVATAIVLRRCAQLS